MSIIEFADLECPYCARYQATLDSVASRYPKDVQIVYIGFPLDFHRFALPAARAAECAAEHGQVSAWMRAVYSKQDSLGIKSWASFARDAGIIDTLMIHRCAVDPAAVKRIVEGRDFGKRINVTGTPTVMVNGWVYLYSAAPRAGKLSALIDTLLAGKKPFRS
jgi:protein-disulfide isomerase